MTSVSPERPRESEEDHDFLIAPLLLRKPALAQLEEPEYNQGEEGGRSPGEKVGNQALGLALSALPVTSLFLFPHFNMSSEGLWFSLT